MKFIAHRGNLNGPQPTFENTHGYLLEAISAGHDVEVDVQAHDNILYLGHDDPRQVADIDFLHLSQVFKYSS